MGYWLTQEASLSLRRSACQRHIAKHTMKDLCLRRILGPVHKDLPDHPSVLIFLLFLLVVQWAEFPEVTAKSGIFTARLHRNFTSGRLRSMRHDLDQVVGNWLTQEASFKSTAPLTVVHRQSRWSSRGQNSWRRAQTTVFFAAQLQDK